MDFLGFAAARNPCPQGMNGTDGRTANGTAGQPEANFRTAIFQRK